MNKMILKVLSVFLFAILLCSCGSSKKGCGLTSDAEKIEQSVNQETTLVAEVISDDELN